MTTKKKAIIFYIASEKFEPGFIASTTRDYYKVISYFNSSKGQNVKPSYLSQLCEDLGEDPELYFNKVETVEYSDLANLTKKSEKLAYVIIVVMRQTAGNQYIA